MLKTKSIKTPKSPTDGLRISVMSRHTLDDGLIPDPEINSECFDQWWRVLAPPAKLIGDYYKRGLSWEQFELRYLAYLSQEKTKTFLYALIRLAQVEDVTILCKEPTPEHCHRRLLAEKCQELDLSLEIEIK